MMTRGKGKKLRSGFTTGTAAAAATKGALKLLLEGRVPNHVRIRLLTGDRIRIPIHSGSKTDAPAAQCTVIKDAGDDPDVTHRAEIGARVRFFKDADPGVTITGGEGVGRVTKPGLSIPPGEPAITEGPRQMISEAVRDLLEGLGMRGSVSTEIFVPEGRNLAKKTLNARLGILGGISILGTTGVVRPISHEA
ncbi:MAG: cobalt-precorrin-5B (C(1))-methyltransferase CbiD, partial [Pseudomonadota bacterium]